MTTNLYETQSCGAPTERGPCTVPFATALESEGETAILCEAHALDLAERLEMDGCTVRLTPFVSAKCGDEMQAEARW